MYVYLLISGNWSIAGVDILQAEFVVGEEIPHRQQPVIWLPCISDRYGPRQPRPAHAVDRA
jgi:hypothetical protein